MDDFSSQPVYLHIYDLTQGMAKMMSQMLLGRHIDGVWHTAVVAYGREYFFGSQGVVSCPPCGTVLGQPLKVEKIGDTFIPYSVFKDYIRGLSESRFRGADYNLLKHNCNTFSEDLCQFLCGSSIPKYILDLPDEFLSTPLGQSLGPLLGRHIDGVWHTAVVAYGREYFFGSQGVVSCPPCGTVLGQPLKVEKIGDTFIPYSVFKDYIRGLSESRFRGADYNLLKHNCNTFSEDLCQFLCGSSIPKYILDLPDEFLSTPLGQSLGPLLEQLSSGSSNTNHFSFEPQTQHTTRNTSPGFDELNTEIEEARIQSVALQEKRQTIAKTKAEKKEKKREKKKKRHEQNGTTNLTVDTYSSNSGMSEVESEMNGGSINNGVSPIIPSEMLPSEQVLEDEARERQVEEEKRKNRDPPVIFTNIDAKIELEALVKLVDGRLSKDEETSIEELHQYLIENEGSWALGDNFLVFVGRILQDANISTETRVHLLRALAAAALKDDVILLLHQDRRDHVLMNYAQDIESLKPEEQQALAMFMCNLFENTSSSEWLLYISEWTYKNNQTSNIRATTKVAVHCLLAACPTLQDIGSGIIHNLACKEVKTVVFDDVAIELAMALLQFFNSQPNEEHLFRTLKALAKFVTVSPDIPQLVQMIGPHPKTFKGKSSRIDTIIEQISKKVR